MASLRLPALEAFSGKQEDFESFGRRLKAFFISNDNEYNQLFNYAETTADVITDDIFSDNEENLKRSHDLHYVLVQLCRSTSETVLLQSDSENGLEDWRRLHSHYKRPSMNTSMGRLTKVLEYDFKNLEEDFIKWEAEIHHFEKETSSLLPSMVKTAILMTRSAGPLQQHLQLNASHKTDFREVREMVLNFSKVKNDFKKSSMPPSPSSFASTPMEVDAVGFKGKGKGKGKGKDGFKGKGKGKGPSQTDTA